MQNPPNDNDDDGDSLEKRKNMPKNSKIDIFIPPPPSACVLSFYDIPQMHLKLDFSFSPYFFINSALCFSWGKACSRAGTLRGSICLKPI